MMSVLTSQTEKKNTQRVSEESHVKMEAEIAGTLPQTKEPQEPQDLEVAERILLQGLQREQGSADILILDIWLLELGENTFLQC